MKLCMVRHGETAWNAEGRVQGQLDVPLSDTGHAQARAVAQALAGESFDVLYSSDLVRVQQTARPLASLLGKSPILDARLRERHYGIFQGMTYAQAREELSEDFLRFRNKDPDYDFQTGESLRAFSARVLQFMQDLLEKEKGRSVLVFTHGGVLEILYRHATSRGLSTPRDFEIPNAALNRFEHGAGAWQIHCWADVAHLASLVDEALDDLPDG
ncbi:MAG TPA: histidine phosphatase family protein [Burkholderiales bacterium]|nr:histidine phosphatase family protein [Burkholderiales bacterium]